jgi:hypothetical protein
MVRCTAELDQTALGQNRLATLLEMDNSDTNEPGAYGPRKKSISWNAACKNSSKQSMGSGMDILICRQ